MRSKQKTNNNPAKSQEERERRSSKTLQKKFSNHPKAREATNVQKSLSNRVNLKTMIMAVADREEDLPANW